MAFSPRPTAAAPSFPDFSWISTATLGPNSSLLACGPGGPQESRLRAYANRRTSVSPPVHVDATPGAVESSTPEWLGVLADMIEAAAVSSDRPGRSRSAFVNPLIAGLTSVSD